ncbi:MAG: cupredoxin domain-containing protein, partial [Chloroflexota bacterium]
WQMTKEGVMKNLKVLLSILFFLTACSGAPSGDVAEFNVEMREYSFSLDTLTVAANQKVRVNILNKGNIEHDFSIMEIPTVSEPKVADPSHGHSMTGPEPQLHASALPGIRNTVEFTPTKPGTYEFYCVISGHKEQGMAGKLIVK